MAGEEGRPGPRSAGLQPHPAKLNLAGKLLRLLLDTLHFVGERTHSGRLCSLRLTAVPRREKAKSNHEIKQPNHSARAQCDGIEFR